MFLSKEEDKKEETVLQRSCRYVATQRYNLSAVRIDLNALDLQRREARCCIDRQRYLYAADDTGLYLW